ncbi:hypothetical protein ABT317_23540 [Streptomyces carpinensis]|uniref:Uncharacterized protein n=1 Tax=Streptomyces carpinensis TaxID=66369 RepID=A0ABV1W6P6_9ACTN
MAGGTRESTFRVPPFSCRTHVFEAFTTREDIGATLQLPNT